MKYRTIVADPPWPGSVKFRRHAHSAWEYGTIVGRAFEGDRGESFRWQMVAPLVITRDEPTTLAVPILADRLRAVDSDFQEFTA